jgi:hypothetical protein
MRAGKYKNKGGWHHTDEYKKMMSEKLKGRVVSEETRKKISGENHYLWRGDNASYGALHTWVRNHAGTPNYCENCKTSDKRKRYEWANISREYKRELSDYKRLCVNCHRKYDSEYRKQNEINKN